MLLVSWLSVWHLGVWCIKRAVLFWGGAAIVLAVKETRGCWHLKDMRWAKIVWHFLCRSPFVVFNIIHRLFTDLRHHGCNKFFAKFLFNLCFVLNYTHKHWFNQRLFCKPVVIEVMLFSHILQGLRFGYVQIMPLKCYDPGIFSLTPTPP